MLWDKIKLFDVVALTGDLLGCGLYRWQVDTLVEIHKADSCEVEFVDPTNGHTYGLAPVRSEICSI